MSAADNTTPHGRVITSSGLVIGGAYTPPPPPPSFDAEAIQAALLTEPRRVTVIERAAIRVLRRAVVLARAAAVIGRRRARQIGQDDAVGLFCAGTVIFTFVLAMRGALPGGGL